VPRRKGDTYPLQSASNHSTQKKAPTAKSTTEATQFQIASAQLFRVFDEPNRFELFSFRQPAKIIQRRSRTVRRRASNSVSDASTLLRLQFTGMKPPLHLRCMRGILLPWVVGPCSPSSTHSMVEMSITFECACYPPNSVQHFGQPYI